MSITIAVPTRSWKDVQGFCSWKKAVSYKEIRHVMVEMTTYLKERDVINFHAMGSMFELMGYNQQTSSGSLMFYDVYIGEDHVKVQASIAGKYCGEFQLFIS